MLRRRSRFASSPLCRRLLRRLVAEHDVQLSQPIEHYCIVRQDAAIRANVVEGMDYVVWTIYEIVPTYTGPRIVQPRALHARWAQCGFVECVIESGDPVSQLVREHFVIQATYGRIQLARSGREL